jgi:hypothetical protein
MRFKCLKTRLKTAVLATTVFLLGAGLGVAQVNLTAGPSTLTMPDGSAVPMWGYSCGTAVAPSTCAKSNPLATGWSPVLITVPTGSDLTINLTNNLSFGATKLPTSLMIVGQLGGGLGNSATSTPSPDHSTAQSNVTWPIASAGTGTGTPPVQGNRVQSFSTEVAAGATTSLTWVKPRAGTYLIESGTHPSIQGPMGLYGILVVTNAPAGATAGTAYPAVPYNADLPVLLSEIDPVQNNAVSTAVSKTGFTETAVWSGLPGGCGNPSSATYQTCYPPTVNYSPMYYLLNGVAFDKTHPATSLFPASPATGVTGTVLVRFVNAGSRMHVPSIVGSQTGTPALSGFSLIAEDGNPLPGVARVQSEVFLAAGKTYDVMVNAPPACTPVAPATTCTTSALPVFDRELSLSGNGTGRDAGMLAYLSVNGATFPSAAAFASAVANPDTYNSLTPCAATPCPAFSVMDSSKGLIANDINVYGVNVLAGPTHGTLTLNANGTFSYVPSGIGTTADSFTYCANGSVTAGVCSSGKTATVTLGKAAIEAASGITMANSSYTSNMATYLSIKSPGILSGDKDALGYPLTVLASSIVKSGGLTVTVDPNGGFNASGTAGTSYTFTYKAQNSQGTVSATAATVTVTFPTPSNLAVTVVDGKDKTTAISDYRWIIEEDRTFFIDPNKTTNTCASCPVVPTFGTNFHTSYMPVVATGCTGSKSCESGQTVVNPATGAHVPTVCNIGNGACTTSAAQETAVTPDQVHLDPTKRYYISVLPGDAATPFITANASPGHGMGGAPIAAACIPVAPATTCTGTFAAVTVLAQPTPFPPAKLSVFVFEDDFPLNGEQDAGGGIDVLATNEPGLGQFNITIMDDAGGSGDPTGQVDYDMFNQPLANGLAGMLDPSNGNDACPIGKTSRIGAATDVNQTGITGTIVTCPKFESDGVTLSPLAGQAVISNMMPGRYGVIATPGADRIGRGEEWLQTNTLDGQKAHDSFLKIGEAGYFQEYGPAGYHVSIGFANPAIINSRKAGICNGTDPVLTGTGCTNTVKGMVTTERMSRTPDERLYSSGDNSSFGFTQCYVSLGDTDGEDFAFTKCDSNGNFSLSGIPDGSWRVTVFDQWNDMLVDGLSTPVRVAGGGVFDMGQIATNQWQANFSTRTFFDINGDGVSQDNEPGLALVKTNVRYRDGSFSNRNNTDLNGYAAFNEEFPLFSWYVLETDATRYKNTGTHIVYDSGGPADGTACAGTTGAGAGAAACGNSTIGHFKANTAETVPLPTDLRVPGAFYCANADCTDAPVPLKVGGAGGSTGRVDPPWVLTEGWQGYSGQNNFLEFGKKPYIVGENGGIRGHVVYSSTRPFDDPQFGTQNVWEPLVPGVTINLYLEGTAVDGITPTLKLIDTTKTSSFDDWAQGFRSDGKPNMNCPGQITSDLFFFTLQNQPSWLDLYNSQHNGGTLHTIPYSSQYKCYDGMHSWNQLQPAPYDGMYQFPSVTAMDPISGKQTGTNCTACSTNPDSTDAYRFGAPMLPKGKYVVEVVVPPGYVLVKEEDKNILIGDNFIAPVTVEFPGLGSSIYIIPDQAQVGASQSGTNYNPNNPNNPSTSLGRVQTLTSHEGDTPTVDTFWPCVGATRIVPDYISLYPQSKEVAPFAGATKNLCDRKEVTLDDQTSSQAEFFIFTPTHAAAHFTGVITDDFTSEFDPFSPQFGEKFAPPNLPISIKDWTGNEVSRVYTDQWGAYNGLTYSTWEVNPPNPTGYSPTMMVTCMNDPGTGVTPDPLFNPGYSQFCYEIPFMPGQTQYMDTPVTPTTAFSEGYNHPDCAYPDATPAISEVDGDGVGPWVSAAGKSLKITALGNQLELNNGYSGPAATTAPFNAKTVTRHYGFGATQGTGSVTIGGVAATVTGWSDTSITVTVPSTVPVCAMQQQAQYGGSTARCGELVITAGNGKHSVDTITVTIGGKAPTQVVAGTTTIQSAIDAAAPGDLLMVNPGTFSEMLLMWKPVRLQGVGAASSIINGNAQPEGKLDPWRAQVSCLFGLALNGQPSSNGHDVPEPGFNLTPSVGYQPTNVFDPTGTFSCPGNMKYFNGGDNNPQVDRLPLEAVIGWDTSLNGNLAQLLQEPSLMGAYEGAGITVLAKGVRFPSGVMVFGIGPDTVAGSNIAHEGQMPLGTNQLTNSSADCNTLGSGAKTGYSSNFQCNPSRIDGLSITDSSQGGGGVFVHGWAHNLEIANNRVYNNSGTLTGGITIGQGESPDAYLTGNGGDPLAPTGGFDQQPWTCVAGAINRDGSQNPNPPGFATNAQLPYCFNQHVNVHHNSISLNSSIGDELYSSTPAGAGGVTFAIGSDWYQFANNFVCGNLSTGDGGGLAHLGFSYDGDIEHNSFLFNQSTNPTIPTNGGGIIVMGAAPDGTPVGAAAGTECGSVTDVDCAPGLSDGTGPGLVINANLIMGNAAESGSGGGIRFQDVNGTEVGFFPTNPTPVAGRSPGWNSVNVTNNIIANNVAGWDGAGVSLQDALMVNLVNNTIMSNDSTASAGVLFNTLGAPIASAPGATNQTTSTTTSAPQPAGVVTMQNTSVLTASLPATVKCPTGHFTNQATNGNCRSYSVPLLANDVIWQNRSFYIGVGPLGSTTLNQQNVVALYNSFSTTPAVTQPTGDATTANGSGAIVTGGTGACPSPASYWDIGARGDTGPTNHSSGITLAPTYSVLTDAGDYPGNHNTASNPTVMSQYCNGSRTPPEYLSMGYQVPPGISDATVPNPIFNLTPSATVDEGNNWINMSWGPLALTNPVNGTTLGNYALASGSPAIDYIPSTATTNYAEAPSNDFFSNPRKTNNNAVDVGAVEFLAAPGTPIGSVTGGPLAFGNATVGSASAAQTLTLHNTATGTANLTGIGVVVTAPFSRSGGTCGATLAAGSTCTITVLFSPTVAGAATGTATITSNVAITGSPVALSGTGVVPVISATLTPTTWSYGTQTRNCPGTGLGAIACLGDPTKTFTLTNTGNVTLTGIGDGVLGGTNANEFSITRLLSTCGPAGGGQLTANTTLAPGATCVVTVQFKPLTAQTTGLKNGTISVTSAAGTKTSALTGTAN